MPSYYFWGGHDLLGQRSLSHSTKESTAFFATSLSNRCAVCLELVSFSFCRAFAYVLAVCGAVSQRRSVSFFCFAFLSPLATDCISAR